MTTEFRPISEVVTEDPRQKIFHEKVQDWVHGETTYEDVLRHVPSDVLNPWTEAKIFISTILAKFGR